jgi:hypothetical protein
VPRPAPRTSLASPLRLGLLALALAGAGLLIAAEFSTLYEIKVITVVKETRTGGDHHGYALLIIGVAAAVMAVGATLGGARAAAFALLVLALGALAVTLFVDYPDVDEAGLLADLYERAESHPRTGFYLETLGAALLLVSGAGALLLSGGRRASTAA